MDIAALILSFLTAAAISAGVVSAFAPTLDAVIHRLVSGDLGAGCSRFAKFALFVGSLVSGLRLKELESFVAGAVQGGMPVTAGQCLMEVYKSGAGSLVGGAWVLLAFFGVSVIGYAILYIYDAFRPIARRREEHHRPSIPTGRI